jgi:nitrous oxidase accessory protein NosD
VAVDGLGNAYIAGGTHEFGYSGAPILGTEDAFDPTFNGGMDGFVTKITAAPPPTILSLAPASGSSSIAAEHCVTATAKAGAAPSANVAVRFTVSGANTESRTKATRANGEAKLCYSGTETGVDDIAAYADNNRNGTKEPSEPGDTATVSWTPRTAPPATIAVDGDDSVSDADGCGGGSGTAADPCNTIKAGVKVAAPGDTVAVETSATAYVEEVTVGKAGLELLGPQDGVPAYERPRAPTFDAEAMLKAPPSADAAVTVAAPGVVVSGFTFRGTHTASRPSTPVIDVRARDAGVFDNLIRDNGAGIRISASGAFVSDNVFQDNDQFDSRAPGISADGALSGLDISDNLFDDNGNAAADLTNVSGLVFAGNVVSSPNSNKFQHAVTLTGVVDAIVRDNAIIGADEFGVAVHGADGVTITGNLIAESETGAIAFARDEDVRNRNVVVSGNDLIANGDRTFSRGAIQLFPFAFADTLEVVANRFVDNYWSSYPVGLAVEAADRVVAAENNWWGCNEGPYHGLDLDQDCDAIYGGFVDTDPWLQLSLDASPAEVAVPGSASLSAGLLANSDGATPPQARSFPDVLIDLDEVAGIGTLSTPQIGTSGGVGTATLSSAAPGSAEVHAYLDYGESVASVLFENPPAPPAAARDVTVPVIGQVSVKPATFAVYRFGAAETLLRARVAMGTVFGYSLSEGGTVTFAVERVFPGRKVGRKCRPVTRTNRGKRRCTRYRLVGRFAVSSRAGRNEKPFSGKIGKRSLGAGRYRAILSAVDAGGNRSKPKLLKFRIARR